MPKLFHTFGWIWIMQNKYEAFWQHWNGYSPPSSSSATLYQETSNSTSVSTLVREYSIVSRGYFRFPPYKVNGWVERSMKLSTINLICWKYRPTDDHQVHAEDINRKSLRVIAYSDPKRKRNNRTECDLQWTIFRGGTIFTDFLQTFIVYLHPMFYAHGTQLVDNSWSRRKWSVHISHIQHSSSMLTLLHNNYQSAQHRQVQYVNT